MEDITDANYMHTNRLWEYFEIKILGEEHGLYLKRDTLILADVFKTSEKNCV